jgi:CubicO group peptidase (beta-lactamase class C family)
MSILAFAELWRAFEGAAKAALRSAFVLVAVACVCSCAPSVYTLHPITGDTFGFQPPSPPSPPYGPFDVSLTPQKRFEKLVTTWRQRLAKSRDPGGAIAVVIDGHLRFAAGLGTREVGRHEPVTATTRFRTASISKMLIAATVMSLVEHDGLELSHPLTEFVPYFQRGPGYDASAVTLEMLLTHTGGIPDSVYCPDGASLRATIDAHASDPYWSPPGRLFNYSNADYALLAAVIEEKMKRPFEQVVRERILRPAGMRTAFYSADERDPTIAYGHARRKVVWTHPVDCEASRAAGGVIASVTDFAHFAEALLAGGATVLSTSSVAAMSNGKAQMEGAPLMKYGYGLMESEQAGLRTVEHSGAAAGFSTLVRMVPERGFAVVAFANGTKPPSDVVDAAISAFLGVPEGRRERIPSPITAWPAYVGSYEDQTGSLGRFHVFVDGGNLRMKLDGGQRPPFPLGGGTFVRDANGDVEYFVTRLGVARRLR